VNENKRARALIRVVFWGAVAVAAFTYAISFYLSGDMVNWYYYRAATDGYAINNNAFLDATTAKPVVLTVVQKDALSGPEAVQVKKGDLLPRGANGVISAEDVAAGKRVALENNQLKVMVPTQIKEQAGIKYRDSYQHKGVQTNPWSGPWNVGMVLIMGLSLGMLAQAITDALGMEFKAPKQAHAHSGR